MQSAQLSLPPLSPSVPNDIATPPSTVAASPPVLRLLHSTARPETLRAALFEMARQGDCDAGRQLIQSGLVMPGASDPVNGECALMLAAENRQSSFVRMLLRYGAPTDQRRADGTTSLMLAAAAGDAVIVQMLLQAGAAAGQASASGVSSLILAAWSGATLVVTMLLDAGAPVDHATSFGWTALMRAAQGGHVATVEALLASGGGMECVDCNNRTALMIAAEAGHAGTVLALADAGADITRWDDTDRSAAEIAGASGHRELAQMLSLRAASQPRYMARDDGPDAAPVRETTRTATTTWTTFVATTSSAVDPATTGAAPTTTASSATAATTTTTAATTPTTAPAQADGRHERRPPLSALRDAIAANDLPALRRLLDTLERTCRNVTARLDRTGPLPGFEGPEKACPFTPLMLAAYLGHVEMINALIDAGATVDLVAGKCRTALMIAAEAGHAAAARALVEAGADVTCRDDADLTAAELAGATGHRKLAKALSERARSQPRYLSSDDETEGAPERKTTSTVRTTTTSTTSTTATTAAPAPAGARADDGPEKQPLSSALLDAIADHDLQNLLRLLATLKRTFPNVTAQLDRAGSLPAFDGPDEANVFTPLIAAAFFGHADMIRALVDAGATVDLPGYQDRTALMIARTFNRETAVKMLVHSGALVIRKDDEGWTAEDIVVCEKLAAARASWVKSSRKRLHSFPKMRANPQSLVGRPNWALGDDVTSMVVHEQRDELYTLITKMARRGRDMKAIRNCSAATRLME